MKVYIDAHAIRQMHSHENFSCADLFELNVSEVGVVTFGPCVLKGVSPLAVIYDPTRKAELLKNEIERRNADLELLNAITARETSGDEENT